MTDSGFCSYTNPSRATIPLIRPHQCDSEGGRIRGVLLYFPIIECALMLKIGKYSDLIETLFFIQKMSQSKFGVFVILFPLGVVHNYRHLWKRTQRTLGGRGSGTTIRFSPENQHLFFNHWQCIIKYCTCLECGQYAHICRSFMYNNTFEALFLTSKCTKRGFLWTQIVAPHRGFCKAAQRRYRIFSTWADSSSQNRTKLRIFH